MHTTLGCPHLWVSRLNWCLSIGFPLYSPCIMRHDGVWQCATIGALDAGLMHRGPEQTIYSWNIDKAVKVGHSLPQSQESDVSHLTLLMSPFALKPNNRRALGKIASRCLDIVPESFFGASNILYPSIKIERERYWKVLADNRTFFLCGNTFN